MNKSCYLSLIIKMKIFFNSKVFLILTIIVAHAQSLEKNVT